MPIIEAAPEIAEQAQKTVDFFAEAPADMTSEQAIQACPYLGNLALQDPELAEQKAQEYISDPEKMTQIHPARETDEDDSFWDDLEEEFASDESEPTVKDEKSDLSEEPAPEEVTAIEIEMEPEPDNAQLYRENIIAQEEIKELPNDKSASRRKHVKSHNKSKGNDRAVNLESIARVVIAKNQRLYQDFKNGNTGLLNILVEEGLRLSKAVK